MKEQGERVRTRDPMCVDLTAATMYSYARNFVRRRRHGWCPLRAASYRWPVRWYRRCDEEILVEGTDKRHVAGVAATTL